MWTRASGLQDFVEVRAGTGSETVAAAPSALAGSTATSRNVLTSYCPTVVDDRSLQREIQGYVRQAQGDLIADRGHSFEGWAVDLIAEIVATSEAQSVALSTYAGSATRSFISACPECSRTRNSSGNARL